MKIDTRKQVTPVAVHRGLFFEFPTGWHQAATATEDTDFTEEEVSSSSHNICPKQQVADQGQYFLLNSVHFRDIRGSCRRLLPVAH